MLILLFRWGASYISEDVHFQLLKLANFIDVMIIKCTLSSISYLALQNSGSKLPLLSDELDRKLCSCFAALCTVYISVIIQDHIILYSIQVQDVFLIITLRKVKVVDFYVG